MVASRFISYKGAEINVVTKLQPHYNTKTSLQKLQFSYFCFRNNHHKTNTNTLYNPHDLPSLNYEHQ